MLHRVLPDEDHTSWVLALYEALADMALAGKAYTYKKGMSRKPGGRFKWLIPAALYGQVREGCCWVRWGAMIM